jgi:hypothetical protein
MVRFRSVLLALTVQVLNSQSCYYPNGNKVTQEPVAPCSTSEDSICCPLNWVCLSNFLCFNPSANIAGRYSCTDKSWGSSCPGFCTESESDTNSSVESKLNHSR